MEAQAPELRLAFRPGAAIVLAIERFEAPVHMPERRPLHGEAPGGPTVAVEAVPEIIADKVVATVDRRGMRGSMKLRDVYDLAFLLERGRPDRDLILRKLEDYGLPADLGALREVAASLDARTEEALREQFRAVLPERALGALDAAALLAGVRALFEELSR